MIKYFIYRFPFLLLIFTTLAIIFSVISVFQLDYIDYNYKEIFIFLLTGLIFLFHIRVVDDYRDFDHDTKYYSERELQKGKLNIKKLFISAEILISIILILNFYYFGFIAIFILILGWINSLFSIDYLGYGKKIEKKYMILYHILNNFTLNTFFIYLYYNLNIFGLYNNFLIIIHLIFLNLLVFLLEITRKIKSKEEKNIGDKYIDKYGYKKNFIIISSIIIFIYSITTYINLIIMNQYITSKYIIYSFLFLLLLLSLILHLKYKNKKLKIIIILLSLIFYFYSNLYFI